MLPTVLTGGKWDLKVANLLLATVNFEPFFSNDDLSVMLDRNSIHDILDIKSGQLFKVKAG